MAFEAGAGETAHLCTCKHTETPPFCDGTHATLPEGGVEPGPSTSISDKGVPIAVLTPEEPHVKAIQAAADRRRRTFLV
jgi:hypothetical protein